MVTAATSILTSSLTNKNTVRHSKLSTKIISGVSVLAAFMVLWLRDLLLGASETIGVRSDAGLHIQCVLHRLTMRSPTGDVRREPIVAV